MCMCGRDAVAIKTDKGQGFGGEVYISGKGAGRKCARNGFEVVCTIKVFFLRYQRIIETTFLENE